MIIVYIAVTTLWCVLLPKWKENKGQIKHPASFIFFPQPVWGNPNLFFIFPFFSLLNETPCKISCLNQLMLTNLSCMGGFSWVMIAYTHNMYLLFRLAMYASGTHSTFGPALQMSVLKGHHGHWLGRLFSTITLVIWMFAMTFCYTDFLVIWT